MTGGNVDEIQVIAIKSADKQKALDGIEIKIHQSADSVDISGVSGDVRAESVNDKIGSGRINLDTVNESIKIQRR